MSVRINEVVKQLRAMDNAEVLHLAKAAQIVENLLYCQSTLRRMYGERYDEVMDPVRRIIRGVAAENHGGVLIDATLAIARGMSDHGHDPIIVFAGLCDVIDEESLKEKDDANKN